MRELKDGTGTLEKAESWLRANVRVVLVALVLPTLVLLAGLLIVIFASSWWRWVGAGMIVLALFVGVAITIQLRMPRVAYRDGNLLLYLRTAEPARIPIDVVECFFLGQAPSMMKARAGDEVKTATVVVRLAEAAKEWHNRDVKEELAQWRDGYITIRGTWCEPLTPEVLKRMNRRLAEIHRQRRQVRMDTT